jgi:hypothetical protein
MWRKKLKTLTIQEFYSNTNYKMDLFNRYAWLEILFWVNVLTSAQTSAHPLSPAQWTTKQKRKDTTNIRGI